jgi:lipid-binding SYLF domain-containing protein
MLKPLASVLLAAAFAVLLSTPLAAQDKAKETGDKRMSPQERDKARADLRKMRDETLARLYKENPAAKAEVEKAVGYGVFDARQINVVLLVTGTGAGMLVENGNRKETFIKMGRLGTGPGLGAKSYHQVLVFKDRTLFNQFRTVGADVAASGDATFKPGGKGVTLDGAVSFNPLLSVYQMTDRGVLVQANWGGLAYVPHAELND